MSNDVFTTDISNNAAIRTVAANGIDETNRADVFTTDTDGNAAIRVVGAGGGSVDTSKFLNVDVLPVASVSVEGKFYLYNGPTNSSYTHGYIYECVAGVAYYEANIAFEKDTFASEDFYKAGNLIVDAGVENPSLVASISMTYALAGNVWSIVFKDANGNALNTAYNIYTDDLEQDYDIIPVVDPSTFVDGQVVSGSINNIVEHHDYSWERLDVQPVYPSLPSANGSYVLKCTIASGVSTIAWVSE